MQQKTGQHAYAKLSKEEWLAAWIDYVEGRTPSVELPPFPSEDVQRLTNNLAGRKTIEAAWLMYEIFRCPPGRAKRRRARRVAG